MKSPTPTISWPRRFALLGALALAVAIPVVGHVAGTAAEQQYSLVAFIDVMAVLGLTAVTVGLVILWRKPGNVIGACLLVGALLLMSVFTAFAITLLRNTLPEATPGTVVDLSDTGGLVILWWALVVSNPAIFLLFPAVGILFPDGRLPGPRWRLPFFGAVAMLVVSVVCLAISPWTPPDQEVLATHDPNPFLIPGVPAEVHAFGEALGQLALLLGFALALVAVFVRFRRSRGVERAQLKWLMASVAVMAVAFVISDATDSWDAADLIDQIAFLTGCFVPIAIGIAILRYRLFDIDRIVSRTIGYGVVTGLLLAAFVLGILLFQTLIRPVTGENAVAVAASTLVVAALFQPLRRRVRHVVDRRFDRARYDADRTAAAFSDRIRSEVDTNTVVTDLTATTQAALAPTAVRAWIRPVGSPR